MINRKKFEKLVEMALDSLSDEAKKKMNNLAVFVDDWPSRDQLGRSGRGRRDYMLFGLFEGYGQSSRLNLGPVLPDRITIFRGPICEYACDDEAAVRKQIENTIKHEIAHHFGSDERGARKAGRRLRPTDKD